MMKLDTDPMTTGLRAGRADRGASLVLIQVPRVDGPCVHERVWRPEEAGRYRPARPLRSRSGSAGGIRPGVRPRRRLRRGVRLACWGLLALASMGGTFAIGWMTRDGSLQLPLLDAAALGRDTGGPSPSPAGDGRPFDGPPAEADAIAIGPALSAPVADTEVPVVFPGYVLPDDRLEEPAHEGS